MNINYEEEKLISLKRTISKQNKLKANLEAQLKHEIKEFEHLSEYALRLASNFLLFSKSAEI